MCADSLNKDHQNVVCLLTGLAPDSLSLTEKKGRGRGGESERDILRALSLPPPVLTQQTCDKLYLRRLTTSPSNLLQLPLSGPGRAQRHTQPGLRSLRWPCFRTLFSDRNGFGPFSHISFNLRFPLFLPPFLHPFYSL